MRAEDHRIDVVDLTKRFGTLTALDHLSFSVRPGVVTGFLGPNGSGKTTTLRCLLGLVTPTGGSATIDGRRYRDLDDPLRTVVSPSCSGQRSRRTPWKRWRTVGSGSSAVRRARSATSRTSTRWSCTS